MYNNQNKKEFVTNPIVNMKESNTAIKSSNKNPTVNKRKDTMAKNPIDYEFKTLVQNDQVDENRSKDDTALLINNIQDEVLNEIADSGKDMTTEELLEDILVFDKQLNYEKSLGFTIGAFDKAKDILREQQQQQQNTNPSNEKSNNNARELKQDEELRRMFQAGEQIAESLIDIVSSTSSSVNDQSIQDTRSRISSQQMRNLYQVVNDAVTIGLIDNPLDILVEKGRLQMLLDELQTQPKERYREIMTSFKDLLLSDYFVPLIKVHLKEKTDKDLNALRNDDTSLEQIHLKNREVLGQIVLHAQLLLKEVKALGSELEVHQLEIIRSICKVAMDPSYQTEEEAAIALTDAVRDMRPLLDDTFVAYIKYAVVEEEGKLARNGLLHDPEHNQWLHVLKIVQQGVYNELAKGINRNIEHICYILRMETPIERRRLLEELISVVQTLDVRPFIHVVQNIIVSLGDSTQGNFNDGIIPLGEMKNKLLQLHRDMNDLLPPERIDIMSKDADEWIAKQKQSLLDQRNLTKATRSSTRSFS